MGCTMTAQNKLLEIKGLKKYFPVQQGFWQSVVGWVRAVDDVDLFVPAGGTLGLVGESGCGKSTLAKVVLRLQSVQSGQILFQGRDIAGATQRQLQAYRREVQIVFQDPQGSLNPKMTVGATIEDGLRILGMSRMARRKRVGELLEMVGLDPEVGKRYPHQFSGGQRQRIGLARALSVEPSMIVCDEPISALDVSIQAQIITLLQSLQQELGLSYLFISHDLNVVGYLSDWVAVMYLGQIVEYGPADSLFSSPLHPYTRALLKASPGLGSGPEDEWATLSGDVPSPMNPPPGCRFHPRCPMAIAECSSREVELEEHSPGHLVRCILARAQDHD